MIPNVFPIRQADLSDIEPMMRIITDAQASLKALGVNQWQNGYPTIEIVEHDILNKNAFVWIHENQLAGMFSLFFNDEPTYDTIYDGAWLSTGEFIVLHRLAVHSQYKNSGIASRILREVEKMALEKSIPSFKVDTHQDNIPMRKTLEKSGFSFCGTIILKDGNPRVGYEKLMKNEPYLE